VSSVDLERIIVEYVTSMLGSEKLKGKEYINDQSFEQIYAEGNIIPI